VFGKVEGRNCVYHILGLIPVTDDNELKDAVQVYGTAVQSK
jgi:hypothetical protein